MTTIARHRALLKTDRAHSLRHMLRPVKIVWPDARLLSLRKSFPANAFTSWPQAPSSCFLGKQQGVGLRKQTACHTHQSTRRLLASVPSLLAMYVSLTRKQRGKAFRLTPSAVGLNLFQVASFAHSKVLRQSRHPACKGYCQ